MTHDRLQGFPPGKIVYSTPMVEILVYGVE